MKSVLLTLLLSTATLSAEAASASIDRLLSTFPAGTKIVLTKPISIPAYITRIEIGTFTEKVKDVNLDWHDYDSTCYYLFEEKTFDRVLEIPDSGERSFDHTYSFHDSYDYNSSESLTLLENGAPILKISCTASYKGRSANITQRNNAMVLKGSPIKVILPAAQSF